MLGRAFWYVYVWLCILVSIVLSAYIEDFLKKLPENQTLSACWSGSDYLY